MSQITILSVEKPGNIKEIAVKSIDESELYKKAGFKTPEGFKCHVQWAIEDLNKKSYCIAVYGKTTGRATQENKFEFPPPIDTTLFFGNCIIVNKKGDKIVNLPADEWDSIYEYLYGGFEDLGDDDGEEEEDGQPIQPSSLGKSISKRPMSQTNLGTQAEGATPTTQTPIIKSPMKKSELETDGSKLFPFLTLGIEKEEGLSLTQL